MDGPAAPERKKKIAILGGGAGALAAAFELSSTPERRAAYEITLHQLGFRLGGKGASGRNAEAGHRVEEIGPHVWTGAHETAFRVLRACYDELARPAGSPLATWEEAFSPRSSAVVFCKLPDEGAPDDGWFPWELKFPANNRSPGDGGEIPSAWELFRLGVEWLWFLWSTSPIVGALRVRPGVAPDTGAADDVPGWIIAALLRIEATHSFEPLDHPLVGDGIPRNDAPDIRFEGGIGRLIAWIRNVVRSMPADPWRHDAASHHLLTWLLRRLVSRARAQMADFAPLEQWAYKLWVSIDLATTLAIGFLSDGVLYHGWESIDGKDFREWLSGHGASELTLGSGLVRAIYDAAFAFVNGDPEKGNFAAGTCANALLRLLLTYKGSLYWEMRAGTGDTVFAPLYEVLKKRGVKVDFYHRVAGLHLSADKRRVDKIEIAEQVRLKGDYDPLVDVRGLPCWPSAPLYAQIEEGEALLASGVDLESPYSAPWKDTRPLTLRAGDDFDFVVLGIPIGAIPYIAAELIFADKRFASMVANVGTVQSFSFQLWQSRDLVDLGWTSAPGDTSPPVTTAYVAPVASWSDRTHLVASEGWAEGAVPRNLSFFGGPLEQLGPTPPFLDQGFAARQRARVQSMARKHLENEVGRLWPLATKSRGHGFRWEEVLSQHHRANVDPSDRFVLSVAGSTHHRLAAGKSGFDNVVLAGDWVRTSLNVGSMEAAFEAGVAAAEAILDHG